MQRVEAPSGSDVVRHHDNHSTFQSMSHALRVLLRGRRVCSVDRWLILCSKAHRVSRLPLTFRVKHHESSHGGTAGKLLPRLRRNLLFLAVLLA